MENLGAMAHSGYTGFREIMDRNVLALHCTLCSKTKEMAGTFCMKSS